MVSRSVGRPPSEVAVVFREIPTSEQAKLGTLTDLQNGFVLLGMDELVGVFPLYF